MAPAAPSFMFLIFGTQRDVLVIWFYPLVLLASVSPFLRQADPATIPRPISTTSFASTGSSRTTPTSRLSHCTPISRSRPLHSLSIQPVAYILTVRKHDSTSPRSDTFSFSDSKSEYNTLSSLTYRSLPASSASLGPILPPKAHFYSPPSSPPSPTTLHLASSIHIPRRIPSRDLIFGRNASNSPQALRRTPSNGSSLYNLSMFSRRPPGSVYTIELNDNVASSTTPALLARRHSDDHLNASSPSRLIRAKSDHGIHRLSPSAFGDVKSVRSPYNDPCSFERSKSSDTFGLDAAFRGNAEDAGSVRAEANCLTLEDFSEGDARKRARTVGELDLREWAKTPARGPQGYGLQWEERVGSSRVNVNRPPIPSFDA